MLDRARHRIISGNSSFLALGVQRERAFWGNLLLCFMRSMRFMFSRSFVWVRSGALAAAVILCAQSVRAQETCVDGPVIPPDFGFLIEQFPSHNSTNIPRDGFVRFVYRGRAPTRAIVVVKDDQERTIPGTLAVVGAELHWRSNEPLQQLTTYTARAPDVSGGDQLVRFTTGTAFAGDTVPSNFDGIVNVTSERIGATDICRDDRAQEVTVSWRFAGQTVWPQSELTYVVYETRGPGVGAPIVRSSDRGRLSTTSCASRADQCVTFRLSSANSAGGACFAVQVYDPLGRGMPNLAEKCINLEAGNFFNGCSVGPAVTANHETPGFRRSKWVLVGTFALAFVSAKSARRKK